MAGRHKWEQLKRKTIRRDRLAVIERDATREAARLTLRELRQRLGKTQVQVAGETGSTQSWLSVLEREGADVHLSTLSNYIAALGGELELAVHLKTLGERVVVVLPRKRSPNLAPESSAADSVTRRQSNAVSTARRRERR